ncbi:hypothetical protein [Niabella hibiscisoli]|uniref:hypothetical protein n=1 Tax=Niabella hibiscisoli TaxID=1825928 RepID=UPI001F0F8C68|nr:hypothetical protein [Niabella hibiscisoli]MCH5721142.1 hypothetical protein [Niabella hibiscisoli]
MRNAETTIFNGDASFADQVQMASPIEFHTLFCLTWRDSMTMTRMMRGCTGKQQRAYDHQQKKLFHK